MLKSTVVWDDKAIDKASGEVVLDVQIINKIVEDYG